MNTPHELQLLILNNFNAVPDRSTHHRTKLGFSAPAVIKFPHHVEDGIVPAEIEINIVEGTIKANTTHPRVTDLFPMMIEEVARQNSTFSEGVFQQKFVSLDKLKQHLSNPDLLETIRVATVAFCHENNFDQRFLSHFVSEAFYEFEIGVKGAIFGLRCVREGHRAILRLLLGGYYIDLDLSKLLYSTDDFIYDENMPIRVYAWYDCVIRQISISALPYNEYKKLFEMLEGISLYRG